MTALIPAKTWANMNNRASHLADEGYRVHHELVDGVIIINDGRGKKHEIDIERGVCDCEGFRRRQVCAHLLGAKELLASQSKLARRDLLATLYDADVAADAAQREYVEICCAPGALTVEVEAAGRASRAAAEAFEAVLTSYCLETGSTYNAAMRMLRAA